MGNESLDDEELIQLSGDVDDFFLKVALTYKCDYAQMAATILARMTRLAMDSYNEEGLLMLMESVKDTLEQSQRKPGRMQ